jgi:hypothetical protein
MTPRTCRAHDADDPVEGRICGRAWPCTEHPVGTDVERVRTASGPTSSHAARAARTGRVRIEVELTPEAVRALDRLRGERSRTAAIERLLLRGRAK